jgi:hypothetical protein
MGPPLFDGEQKQIRVLMAIELLQVLSVQSTRQWHDIITLDQSWIYLFSEHDLIWTAPGEIVVDRERHKFNHRSLCRQSCGIRSGSMF